MGFWLTSDKVPAKVIQGATKTCEREDCCLSARIGETTLMGVSQSYDKNGILHVHDDNRFTAELCCKSCWKSWIVDQDGTILKEELLPRQV